MKTDDGQLQPDLRDRIAEEEFRMLHQRIEFWIRHIHNTENLTFAISGAVFAWFAAFGRADAGWLGYVALYFPPALGIWARIKIAAATHAINNIAAYLREAYEASATDALPRWSTWLMARRAQDPSFQHKASNHLKTFWLFWSLSTGIFALTLTGAYIYRHLAQ